MELPEYELRRGAIAYLIGQPEIDIISSLDNKGTKDSAFLYKKLRSLSRTLPPPTTYEVIVQSHGVFEIWQGW